MVDIDKLIKWFCITCWTAPLAFGASIFIRAYRYELQQGRPARLRLLRLTDENMREIMIMPDEGRKEVTG